MSADLELAKTFTGAPCTADEARALTDRIKGTVTAAWVLLLEAYERNAWAALGYGRWEDYVAAEFHLSRSRSYQLLDLGRVARELPAGSGSMSTKVDIDPLPERQARELAPLVPAPEALREVHAEATERTEGKPTAAVIREVREERQERAEYEATATPEPRQARRPQLPDQFFKGVRELTKATERVARLAADDRLARNAEQIAARYGGDLLRAAAVLADVLQRLSISTDVQDVMDNTGSRRLASQPGTTA